MLILNIVVIFLMTKKNFALLHSLGIPYLCDNSIQYEHSLGWSFSMCQRSISLEIY